MIFPLGYDEIRNSVGIHRTQRQHNEMSFAQRGFSSRPETSLVAYSLQTRYGAAISISVPVPVPSNGLIDLCSVDIERPMPLVSEDSEMHLIPCSSSVLIQRALPECRKLMSHCSSDMLPRT